MTVGTTFGKLYLKATRVTGNIITLTEQGHFDILVHGCNCFCTMGAGLALQIKNRYPVAFEVDCTTQKGDQSKLGGFSAAHIRTKAHNFTIVNAYTQYSYGRGRHVNYDAIRVAFKTINQHYSHPSFRIAYPAIGAGLAGGDWQRIQSIINAELQTRNHTFVSLK